MQVNIKKYVLFAFILIALLLFILTALFSGPSDTAQRAEATATEAQARSGMYRMYDTTDESAEGAPNREKFVQVSFTAEGMSFEYPIVTSSGIERTVSVGGETLDGRTYILRHRRSDQDDPSSARWQCTFTSGSGFCLVPNVEGGTNRIEFTKQ